MNKIQKHVGIITPPECARPLKWFKVYIYLIMPLLTLLLAYEANNIRENWPTMSSSDLELVIANVGFFSYIIMAVLCVFVSITMHYRVLLGYYANIVFMGILGVSRIIISTLEKLPGDTAYIVGIAIGASLAMALYIIPNYIYFKKRKIIFAKKKPHIKKNITANKSESDILSWIEDVVDAPEPSHTETKSSKLNKIVIGIIVILILLLTIGLAVSVGKIITLNEDVTKLNDKLQTVEAKNNDYLYRLRKYNEHLNTYYKDFGYITESGTHYHKWGCRYLKNTQLYINSTPSLEEQGYTKCSVCYSDDFVIWLQ